MQEQIGLKVWIHNLHSPSVLRVATGTADTTTHVFNKEAKGLVKSFKLSINKADSKTATQLKSSYD